MKEELLHLLEQSKEKVHNYARIGPVVKILIESKELLSDEIIRLERIDRKLTIALASCVVGNDYEHVREQIDKVIEAASE
tara:strand:- start:59784 stop:60023 length:240 start_codon:yes stop_codon:yes gene_type:complete